MALVITYGYGTFGPGTTQQIIAPFGFGGAISESPNCGLGFYFDSTQLLAPTRLRLRFTQPPKIGGIASQDATYAGNYTLTSAGGLTATITMVSVASDDDEVVDAYLAAPLTPDTWTLTIGTGILSADLQPSLPPYSWVFELAEIAQEPIALGAVNSDAEETLTKFLNPAFRRRRVWGALVAGIAAGDAKVAEIATKAQDQFFPATASGKYLDRRGADRGLERPINTGMQDDAYRQLLISVTNSQLTQESFLRIGEVLYGKEAVYAYVDSGTAEPFVLTDDTTFSLLVDETNRVEVRINRADYQILRRATADELVAVINRALRDAAPAAEARVHTDPVTGDRRVRIFSGRRGLRSAIRVTGGYAQTTLMFPTEVPHSTGAMPIWVISNQGGNRWRFQTDSDGTYDLSNLVVGDYVVIQGLEFDATNRGSFPILAVNFSYTSGVLTQWFEINNPAGIASLHTTQCVEKSVVFFHPTKRTIYDHPAYFLASQHAGISRISMAATTTAVNRTPGEAAYANLNDPIDIVSATRRPDGSILVTTADPHGLVAGRQVQIDDTLPTDPAAITGDNATASFGSNHLLTGRHVPTDISATIENTTIDRVLGATLQDADGDLVLIGGQTQDNVGGATPVVEISTLSVAGRPEEGGFEFFWTRDDVSGAAAPIRPLGRYAALLDSETHSNQLMVGGGFIVGPWAAYSNAPFDANSALFTKTRLREAILASAQLSNTQGIKGAIQVYLTTQATSGDTLTLTDGSVSRTYGFGTGGDVTVTIGGSVAATMTNLVASITGDGPAAWGATSVTDVPPSPSGSIVVHEKIVGGGRCALRAYGNFSAGGAFAVFYGETAADRDYGAGAVETLPASDPGARGGFHRKLAALTDHETHRVIASHGYWQWSTTGAAWAAVASPKLWTQADPVTNVAVADAAAGFLPYNGNAVATGGSEFTTRDTGLNIAGDKIWAYDLISTDTWAQVGTMKEARLQHQLVQIDDDSLLCIGGRQPATYEAPEFASFSWWDFDDQPAAAATFTGPVDVARNANARPAGKLGWGVRCSTAMVASAGAPQTAMNTALLGEYSLSLWMTSATGAVLQNSNPPWAAQADNTLVEFGVDPADDLFYVSWQEGAGGTVHTFKTTATRAELMPVAHNTTYPRYYHVAIVKTVSGANATFKLYIEGALVGTFTAAKPDGGSAGLWAFAEMGVAAAFAGNLDHVGFSAETLDAALVQRLYLSQCGVSYDAPADESFPVGRVLASCELLYDSGSQGLASPMSFARFACGAVTLPDGRVVVAGGVGYRAAQGPSPLAQRDLELRSAEIYDPRTGFWQPLPDMRDPHSYVAMGVIGNRIYVAGGFTSTRIEYLDLATMKWQVSTASLPAARGRAQGGLTGEFLALLGGAALLDTGFEQSTPGDDIMGAEDESTRAGGLNQQHEVLTTPTSTTFTLQDATHLHSTVFAGGTATPLAAAAADPEGPYIFDTKDGFGVTDIAGTIATALNRGTHYTTIDLGSLEAEAFPDSTGYLVFAWGRSYQVGPVKYLGTTSPQTLALDASFAFPQTVPAGARVHLLSTRAPFVPPAGVPAFWLTDSSSGRAAASRLILAVSASGIELEAEIRYPGDRGLGAEGYPVSGNYKLSDRVAVWAGANIDGELEAMRNG
jgi:hypothetical protein